MFRHISVLLFFLSVFFPFDIFPFRRFSFRHFSLSTFLPYFFSLSTFFLSTFLLHTVITTITDEWKHCLPTIVNGYNDNDCIVQMKQHSYLNQRRIDHSFSAKRTAKKASVEKNDIPFYFAGIGVGLTHLSL